MNWIQRCRLFAKVKRSAVSNVGVPLLNSHRHGIPCTERALGLHFLRNLSEGMLVPGVESEQRFILARNVSICKLSSSVDGNSQSLKQRRNLALSRGFAHSVKNDPHLSRNFLAQLWIADKKIGKIYKEKIAYSNVACNQHPSFQPPPSQTISGSLKPASPEEALVAPLLARSNLMITRDIEWANLVLGFEQENRYLMVDVCYPQSPVGFICECSNVVARQLLRLRRPFVAYITDAGRNVLFRVRRPFWWITSSIYAEIDGKEVGVVHRRWHLWRRIYDLYLGNKQFAVVENPGFWNWTFTLKDINGGVLAQIDRDWRGFGFEIFTDAGQYVIRFGSSNPSTKSGLAAAIHDLEVVHPLTLSERAVAVALAISLDNDYFSRHGGWGIPFIAVEE